MNAGFVLFNHCDGALLERGFELRKGVSEKFVDVEGARIVHTQQHDRRVGPTRKGQQVTESKIHGEDDAVFGAGFFNNGFIGKALEGSAHGDARRRDRSIEATRLSQQTAACR